MLICMSNDWSLVTTRGFTDFLWLCPSNDSLSPVSRHVDAAYYVELELRDFEDFRCVHIRSNHRHRIVMWHHERRTNNWIEYIHTFTINDKPQGKRSVSYTYIALLLLLKLYIKTFCTFTAITCVERKMCPLGMGEGKIVGILLEGRSVFKVYSHRLLPMPELLVARPPRLVGALWCVWGCQPRRMRTNEPHKNTFPAWSEKMKSDEKSNKNISSKSLQTPLDLL